MGLSDYTGGLWAKYGAIEGAGRLSAAVRRLFVRLGWSGRQYWRHSSPGTPYGGPLGPFIGPVGPYDGAEVSFAGFKRQFDGAGRL